MSGAQKAATATAEVHVSEASVVAGTAVPNSRALAHRLPALTGLRIFAALAVYFSHLATPARGPEALRTFFASGYMGVTVFFVLSGFVIALNYFERLRRPTFVGIYDYLLARVARVYPLYLAVLGYVVLRDHVNGGSVAGWPQHLLALQAWYPSDEFAFRFNAPGWSIGVEFFLYACFPLLVLLLRDVRRPRVTLAIAIGVAVAMAAITLWFAIADAPLADPNSAHRWLYRSPLLRLGDFALGMLAALLYLQTKGERDLARLGTLLTTGSIAVIVVLMAWPANFHSAWSWDVSYALPAVVLIFGLAVAQTSLPARFLSLPFVVLLGEASYAFYLVHYLGIAVLAGGRWSANLSPLTILYEAVVLGVIICLSVGVHVVIERPARTYLRRWLRWRSASPPPAAAPAPAPPAS